MPTCVVALVVERRPDGCHLAVHHPRGSDNVGARFSLGQGNSAVNGQRRVVVDLAPRIEDAAMAMVGVLVETEVGHEDHLVTELMAQR